MTEKNQNRIEVILDDAEDPIAVYSPPARFDLDTTILDDGEHTLKIIAYTIDGKKTKRKIKFVVRNGPGIAVEGLKENDIVDGKISLLVNAYGGGSHDKWEPATAETPSPIPSWIWIIFILIVAWAIFYFMNQWSPPEKFANTPTYHRIETKEKQTVASTNLSIINGADIYRKSCSSCHQENGQGIQNVFPPLVNTTTITSNDPTKHIEIVLFGLVGKKINGIQYSTPMPAWKDQLTDEEIAAVINHERTSWGNNAKSINADDVKKVRSTGK